MNISKKLVVLSCLFVAPMAMADLKRTKKLDILVFITNPGFEFAMNAGNGIETDPFATRPAGATVVFNGWVFPGGTVSKHQTDFSVDRHGNPINPDDNIGMIYFTENMIQTLDGMDPLALDTRFANTNVAIRFKKQCDGEDYVFATGQTIMGTLPAVVGTAVSKLIAAVTGSAGCSQPQVNNSFIAREFQASSGLVPVLIQIRFEEPVQYKD